MKNKTIICHFYNEEYLLPWWLRHHREIFNDGLMIDYGSTDKSVEIIKSLCPSWRIVNTNNEFFGAVEIDREVMEYEKNIDGLRMCLNVTEFLVGNISKLNQSEQIELFIPTMSMVDLPNQHDTYPDINIPLTEQRHHGWNVTKKNANICGGGFSRLLHENKNILYPIGRHYWGQYNTNDFMVLRYKHSPWNKLFISRKMQIAKKQKPSDIPIGFGVHHQFNLSQLNEEKSAYLPLAENLYDSLIKFEYWRY